jgi:hypothetical protein
MIAQSKYERGEARIGCQGVTATDKKQGPYDRESV